MRISRIVRTGSSAMLLLVAAFVAIAPSSAPAATGTGAEFGPDAPVVELHGVRVERGMTTAIHWLSNGRFRSQQTVDLDPVDERTVVDNFRGANLLGSGFPARVRSVILTRNTSTVGPDGWDPIDAELLNYAWPLIAQVRSGGPALTPGTAAGRPVLWGTVTLAANDCAALKAGERTVFLDAATLVPVRVIDRRGGTIDRDSRFTVRSKRVSDFAKLVTFGRREVLDDGFVRRTPAAARGTVTFPISLPTSLPAGFKLNHTGSGKLGAMLGPEASFPRSKGVFFAKWRRGLESIDFTIRGAAKTLATDWDESDPFGAECSSAQTSEVPVGAGVVAKYAIGEDGAPRMWWRTGDVLYTLSGPFSAEQLATVARSLAPIA